MEETKGGKGDTAMNIDGWKYYNHAAIPTVAPHEPVNIQPVKNGTIWRMGGVLLCWFDGQQILIVRERRIGGM